MNTQKTLLTILILFITSSIYSQRIIKGRIINEAFDVVPYAVVFINDHVKVGASDLQGYFEISVPVDTKSLVFGAIGIENTNVLIDESCNYMEVIMLRYGYSEFISSGKKIDRLRKKDFDKLPAFYAEAFKKGIFKNDTPCFKHVFEPIGPRIDEIGRKVDSLLKQDKKDFKRLLIGDTIRVAFSREYRHDGTDRTSLSHYSSVVEGNRFPCIIEGVVIKKSRAHKGNNITYRVTSTQKCKYPSLIYNNRDVVVGAVFQVYMKYNKVLTHW